MIKNVSNEEIVDAIQIHWHLQLGSYFAEVVDISGAKYNIGDKVTDFFWNYAGLIQCSKGGEDSLIKRIIDFAQSKNRIPAAYIDPTTSPADFGEALKRHGFTQASEEIWMFYNSQAERSILKETGLKVQLINSLNQMHQFVDVFNAAYDMQGDDRVYGESLLAAFNAPPEDVNILHYIGYIDNSPVTIASLYSAHEYGGIYNVGTIPTATGKGYGGAISQCAINESLKRGHRRLLLQTELGSIPEHLYSKLGFIQAFEGSIWSMDLAAD